MRSDPNTAPAAREPAEPAKRKRRRWALAVASVAVLVISASAILLYSNAGRTAIVRFTLDMVTLSDGYTLSVGGTSGSIPRDVALHPIRLAAPDGTILVEIDTARVGVRLLPLLRKRVTLTHVRAAGARISMSERPDGSWDLIDAFPAGASSGLSIRIGELAVSELHVTAEHHSATGDSMTVAGPARILAHDIRMVDSYGGRIDSLMVPFIPAGMVTPASLTASVSYFDGRLQVRHALLSSDRSRASAQGSISFPGVAPDVEGDAIAIQIERLAFADVAPVLSTIDPAAVAVGHTRLERNITGWSGAGAFDFGAAGSISFDAAWSREDSLSRVDANLTLESIMPSVFARSPLSDSDRFDGTISAELRGSEPSRMSGVLAVDMTQASVASWSVSGLVARVSVENGRASISARSQVGGSTVSVDGNIRPFADVPSYDMTATIRQLDVGRILQSELTTSLSGTVRVAGSGFANPDLIVTPDLSASRVGSLQVSSFAGTAFLKDRRADVDLLLNSDPGTLKLLASANLATESWQVRNVAVDDLDAMALTGSQGESSLTGRGSGAGTGFDIRTANGDFSLEVDTFRTPAMELTRGSIVGQIGSGAVHFSESATVFGGLVASSGSLSWSRGSQAGTARLALDSVEADSIDIGRVPGMSSQRGTLSASGNGTVTLGPGQRVTGALVIDVHNTILNDVSVYGARAELDFAGTEVAYRLEASSGHGSLNGNGVASIFASPLSFTVDHASFSDVDAGAFLRTPDLTTLINGELSARYQDDQASPLSFSARIQQSTVNGQRDIDGTIATDENESGQLVRADITWPVRRSRGDTTAARRGGLHGFVASYADSADQSRLSASFRLRHLDVSTWWPDRGGIAVLDTTRTDVSFNLSYDGSLGAIDSLNGRLAVDSLRGSIGTNAIRSGRADIVAESGVLGFDHFRIETDAGMIDGRGPIALLGSGGHSDFHLTINAEDLALIGDLIPRTNRIGGFGSLSASIVGPPASQEFVADGIFGSVTYGTNRAATAEVFVEATLDENYSPTELQGNVRVVNFLLGTAAFRETELSAAMDLAPGTGVDASPPAGSSSSSNSSPLRAPIELELSSQIDARRSASITSTLDLDANTLTATAVSIRFDRDQWALLQPATLTYGDALRIRNLLLYAQDQQIAVDGIIDLDGDQSLILTVENFRIGSIADLFGFQGLDGAMNGYLDLVGPADAPVALGELNVELESFRDPVGDLQLSIRYDSLQLHTTGTLNHVAGGKLVVDGRIPVDLRLASSRGPTQVGMRVRAQQTEPDSDVDMSIRADSFSMGWMLPFLDPAVYSSLDGIVDGEVTVVGTFADPAMEGGATIADGGVGLPQFGIEVTEMNGGLTFDGRNITITNMRGRSGRGRVTANGTIELIDLSLGNFDIQVQLEDFLAVDNTDYRARAAGDILLFGTTRAPVLTGSLRLESLDLYYKGSLEEFEAVTLTERDLREVEFVFGRRVTAADTTTYDFFTALEMDLELEMTRDSWLRSDRNPRMDIPFSGRLDVTKERSAEPEIFGTIDIVENRGRIVELGRQFEVTRGSITYNGPIDDPRVDLAATYTVRTRGPSGQDEQDIQISLAATGTMQDLDITLTSDPHMEMTDILSYVLVGRPARASLQFGSRDESLATDVALSQAAGFLEGLAGEELGLDVVRIEYEGTEVKLTAGKYLRPGVYVAISQPIVLNSAATQSADEGRATELLVEVEMLRGLLARLQQQGSVFGLNLLWQYAY